MTHCLRVWFEDCRMLKALQHRQLFLPQPVSTLCRLTVVHDVHAQPQQCPRVGLHASQQAKERQTQDLQHGSPPVPGSLNGLQPTKPLSPPLCPRPQSRWSPRFCGARSSWTPVNQPSNITMASPKRPRTIHMQRGPLESPCSVRPSSGLRFSMDLMLSGQLKLHVDGRLIHSIAWVQCPAKLVHREVPPHSNRGSRCNSHTPGAPPPLCAAVFHTEF